MEKLSGTIEDQIQQVVDYAVRAPSTHNSQPWKFSIENNKLSVLVDESVKMPYSDPEERYKYISLGYLVHHIQTTAEYFNVLGSVDFSPEERVVATFTFNEYTGAKNSEQQNLFKAIEKRQNLRGPFKQENLSQEIMDLIQGLNTNTPEKVELVFSNKKEQVQKIGELTAESMRRVYKNPLFRKEMSHWIKPNNSKEKTGIHGYSLNQKLFSSILLPHIIRMFDVGPLLAKLNYKAITSAQFGIVYATEKNTKTSWFSVGMRASHLTLSLLSRGYNVSIFVASLEHEDTKKDLKSSLEVSTSPQFVMVGGKILVKAPYTPRYSYKEKAS